MRENEKAALQEVVDVLNGLLQGNVPAPTTVAAPTRAKVYARPTASKRVVEATGEPNIEITDEGAGCLICQTGPYKLSDLAVHLWTEHGVPMAQVIGGEELTHGRKWQMSQALKKAGLDEALEGYGRGATKATPKAEPAAAEAPKRWKPKAKPEVTVRRPSNHLLHHSAKYYPDGNKGDMMWVSIAGPWDPESPNILVQKMWSDDEPFEVHKKHLGIGIFTTSEIPPHLGIGIFTTSEIPPQKAVPAAKSWQKKKSAAPAEDEGAFMEKHGINEEQMTIVKDHAEANNLSLEQAAQELELPQPQE
jgi:hypothetical protein